MSSRETARLRVRSWRDEDLETLHRLNSDERIYRYLSGRPLTLQESKAQLERFCSHWDEHGFGLWALEERQSGRLIGRCGLSYHRLWPSEPELGWKLDPDVWGRGYATEAGAEGLRHAFESLHRERVVSIVHPENERSLAVAGRLGIAPWRSVPWDDTGIVLEVLAIRRREWARLQSSA